MEGPAKVAATHARGLLLSSAELCAAREALRGPTAPSYALLGSAKPCWVLLGPASSGKPCFALLSYAELC
eukprot:8384765-Pyramimonas_sp.AAC.1